MDTQEIQKWKQCLILCLPVLMAALTLALLLTGCPGTQTVAELKSGSRESACYPMLDRESVQSILEDSAA